MVTTYAVDTAEANAWAAGALSMLKRFFPADSGFASNFQRQFESFRGYRQEFRALAGIFTGAVSEFRSGIGGSYRALIANEVSEDILEQAGALLSSGYKDASCIVTGVALEVHLRQLCVDRGLPVGSANSMNVELAKSGAYNLSTQKQITAWFGLRNDAAHGNWSEYKAADVTDFIQGVRRFVSEA